MNRKTVPVLALCVFSSMLGTGIVAPLLPLYAENMGASGLWLGIIFGVFSMSRAVFTPVFGRMSDRSGRRRFLLIGMAGYALVSLGYVWAESAQWLTAVRVVQGAASGMIVPIAQAYIGDISPEGQEGKWMGYFNASFIAGFGFGPLLGGAMTDRFGMNAAFYAMGSLNLAAFLIALVRLPKSETRAARDRKLSFKSMSASSTLRGIGALQFATAFGQAATTAFFPIYAALYVGISPTMIGVLLAVQILLSSALQLYSGPLADRLNRNTLVVAGTCMNVVYLAVMPFAHDIWHLVGLSILAGAGQAVAWSATSSLMVEQGRRYGMGSTFAIMNTIGGVGLAAGPLLAGAIYDSANITVVFFFGAAMTLAGTVLYALFVRRPQPAPAKPQDY